MKEFLMKCCIINKLSDSKYNSILYPSSRQAFPNLGVIYNRSDVHTDILNAITPRLLNRGVIYQYSNIYIYIF